MRLLFVRLVVSCLVVLGPTAAVAENQLIEQVVVRNRLYSMDNKVELGLGVGLAVLSRLTDHINLNAIAAYNFSDSFGLELRGGYAFSRHTGLANTVAQQAFTETSKVITQDFADLWEMKVNAAVGVRWAPLYGKISLLAEVPVHFQFYLWLGGGAGTFERESIIICQQVAGTGCGGYLVESKVSGFASAAVGFRLFTHQSGSIKLELRDYTFPDSYRVGIDTTVAKTGAETGTPVSSPGFTNLVMFDLGYVFHF